MGINLQKNQTISLAKKDGGSLSRVRMGLGWDQAKKKGFFGGGGNIDLDASVILFDGSKSVVDIVAFNHLTSNDGSVRHGGDNLTGAGDGDDESIDVDLSRVPAHVQSLVFVITAYSGQAFSKIENVFCRLLDTSNGQNELVRYQLGAEQGNTDAQVMAAVVRSGSGWEFKALGVPARGATANQVVGTAAQSI